MLFGEEKMKTRELSNLNFFQNRQFKTYIKKMIRSFTFGAWSFLLVHIRFTPSERPKNFVNWFFTQIRPWTLDHEKGHLPWSDFMVHGVNRPLKSPNLASDFYKNLHLRAPKPRSPKISWVPLHAICITPATWGASIAVDFMLLRQFSLQFLLPNTLLYKETS